MIMFQEDAAKLRKELTEEKMPVFLTNMEKLLKENQGGDGYFVGNEVHFTIWTKLP